MSISTFERKKILDLHITHNCNLTCESCSDFTNNGLSWMISLDEMYKWIGNWNKRIQPEDFNIIGGEPTLHKNLVEILYLSRELWGKDQKINLITNGFFIHTHDNLKSALKNTNTTLMISLHSKEKQYLKKLKNNIKLVQSWKKEENIELFFRKDFTNWRITHKGYGEDIMPFEDGDPQSSWKNCFSDPYKCFQLYEGNLWKCPPITYLPLMSKKYNLSNKWDPYLKYKPLLPNCSDEELQKFWNSECMDICSMCPAKKIEIEVKKSPLLSVSESKNYTEYYKE